MFTTSNLIIRPLNKTELTNYAISVKDFAESIGLFSHKSIIDINEKEAIQNDLLPNFGNDEYNNLFFTIWIVIEKQSMFIIGSFCFHGTPNNIGEIEVGYGIDKEFQNKGYATELVERIINWAKTQDNITSIIGITEGKNIASIKVLQKNSFELTESSENLKYTYKLK